MRIGPNMKIAYFDCFAGISGDMILGSLVHAGLDPQLLQRELDKLELPAVQVDFQPTSKHAIGAIRAKVRLAEDPIPADQEHHLELDPTAPDHSHRHAPHAHHHLEDVLVRIRDSALDAEVKATAVRIFERLAAAEASVHGTRPDQVHLHEVGALDAVVDVVGAVAGVRLLGVDQVFASPLRFGTGFVRCAHGRYPVPVPGVLALCAGIPSEQTDIRAELVTPTGAAIITTIATGFGLPPPFRQTRVGYGAGRRDLEEVPNLLRIRLGETVPELQHDRMVLVETNIDDMNPEVYGYLCERLLEQGVRDVYLTPVYMKKGRPGNLLSVLVDEDRLDAAVDTILAETTTIGVRYHRVERRKLQRTSTTVETPYGPVRVKTCYFDGTRRSAPEYDDCAQLAQQRQVPLLSVYAAARAALLAEE